MRHGSLCAILGIALGFTGCLGSTAPKAVDDFGPRIEIRALDSGAIVDSIIMTQATFGLTRRPKSNELWATQGNKLSVIDLPTHAIVRTLLIDDPRRIAFDAEGNQGVVTSQSGSVYFLRP